MFDEKKEQRVSELIGRIDEVFGRKQNWGQEAKALRSRLSFASAQMYGRTTASVMEDLGKYGCKHQVRLNGNTRLLLRIMRGHLESGMPRQVTFGKADVMHVFTDGSLEGEGDTDFSAGLGAVLVDEFGTSRHSLMNRDKRKYNSLEEKFTNSKSSR